MYNMIRRKQALHLNEVTPRTVEGNAFHIGGKELNNFYIMLFALMSLSELPRAGGPVRVGLCRDCSPSHSTREGERFAQIFFSFFFIVI